MNKNSIITTQNLNFYYGKLKILEKINLHVDSGEIVTIIGPNGSGKTSLLSILAGITKVKKSYYKHKKNIMIGYMPQKIKLNPILPITVFNFLHLTNSKKNILDVSDQLHLNCILDKQIYQIPGSELQHSSAAYVEAVQNIFGGNWHIIISLVAFIVCLSSLNAWVLTGGQIALGLSEDGLMPNLFAKKNSKNAPYIGLLISGLGIIPLLFLTNQETFAKQISLVIDFSVVAFLFVYVMCVLSFLKIQLNNGKITDVQNFIALFALVFCLWVICNSEIRALFTASLFVLSGLPLYFFWYKKKTKIARVSGDDHKE